MQAIDKVRDEMAKDKSGKITYLGEGMTALLDIPPNRSAEGGDTMELKQCPFCGGEAKMQFGWPAQQNKQKMVFVKCKSCGCKTQTVYQMAYQAWDDCKRYAADAWNRRVNDG